MAREKLVWSHRSMFCLSGMSVWLPPELQTQEFMRQKAALPQLLGPWEVWAGEGLSKGPWGAGPARKWPSGLKTPPARNGALSPLTPHGPQTQKCISRAPALILRGRERLLACCIDLVSSCNRPDRLLGRR